MQQKALSDDACPTVKKRRTIEEGSKDTRWIAGLLGKWENPVFNRPETPLPSISTVEDYHSGELSSYFHKREKKFSMPEHMHSSALPSLTSCDKKLTKKYLSCAKFLAQVDDKFLLVQMNAPGSTASHGARSILVLIDQHAADERCRVESLFEDICRIRGKQCDDDAASADVTELPKPVVFTVSANEAQLFKRYAGYFRSWGCHYAITARQKPTSTSGTITVLKVPTAIAERCRLEPRIVIDMLRREIWSQADQNAGYTLDRDVKTQTRPGEASQSLSSSSESEAGNASLSWTDHISSCPRGI
ncbi:DNA mismatch repair protein, partial [Ascosphaera atra]